jgi:hypothetical protein
VRGGLSQLFERVGDGMKSEGEGRFQTLSTQSVVSNILCRAVLGKVPMEAASCF